MYAKLRTEPMTNQRQEKLLELEPSVNAASADANFCPKSEAKSISHPGGYIVKHTSAVNLIMSAHNTAAKSIEHHVTHTFFKNKSALVLSSVTMHSVWPLP